MRCIRLGLLPLCLLPIFTLAPPAVAASSGKSPGTAHAGLVLADTSAGNTIVKYILAGPLQGDVVTSETLARPDLVVAIDGLPMKAAEFDEYLSRRRPGEPLTVTYRRALKRGGWAMPADAPYEEEDRKVEITLVSRDLFTGTLGRGSLPDLPPSSAPPWLDPANTEEPFGAAMQGDGLAEPLNKLVEALHHRQKSAADPHGLQRFREAILDPLRLIELARSMGREPELLTHDPRSATPRLVVQNWDADDSVLTPNPALPVSASPASALYSLAHLLFVVNEQVDEIFGAVDADQIRDALAFSRVPSTTYFIPGADSDAYFSLMRKSLALDYSALAAALLRLDIGFDVVAEFATYPTMELPEELASAVEGEILGAVQNRSGHWVVLGASGPNRYDLSRVSAIFDLGGDDHYGATGLRPGVQWIVDLEGDDLYEGTADQGPGAALFGVSWIDDRAGKDRYVGGHLSAGAALFGASLLLDRGGADTYSGESWSLGAGFYGAGLLVDLGPENDRYECTLFCQAIGGPRGLGMLVDEGGREHYRSLVPPGPGPQPAFKGFSQGVGFGFRFYTAGGIGILSDLAGDDRYESEETSQGIGYHHGLGVLYDAKGRDVYYGGVHVQGSGSEQGVGVLMDEAGDDAYLSSSIASQGTGWNEGVGLLFDGAGNDTYRSGVLSQGGAANRSMGLLIDLAGSDHYNATGKDVQGRPGGENLPDPLLDAVSFSLLLDLGAALDHYSNPRTNDGVLSWGNGLFIDR